jgi:hypothetical protein
MKENIRTYKIIIVTLSCVLISLVAANVLVYRGIRSKGAVKTSTSSEIRVIEKTYGYVDILNIMNEYESLKLIGINSSREENNIVSFDASTEDNVPSLQDIFEELKKEACFLGVDNIKIHKYGDNKSKVNFTARFIKNK